MFRSFKATCPSGLSRYDTGWKMKKKKRNEETIETNSFCEKDTVKEREKEKGREGEKRKKKAANVSRNGNLAP